MCSTRIVFINVTVERERVDSSRRVVVVQVADEGTCMTQHNCIIVSIAGEDVCMHGHI